MQKVNNKIFLDTLGLELGSKVYQFFLRYWLTYFTSEESTAQNFIFISRSAQGIFFKDELKWSNSSVRYYFTDLLNLDQTIKNESNFYFSTFINPLVSVPSYCLLPLTSKRSDWHPRDNFLKKELFYQHDNLQKYDYFPKSLRETTSLRSFSLLKDSKNKLIWSYTKNFIFCNFSFFPNELNSMNLRRNVILDFSRFYKKDLVFDDGVVIHYNRFHQKSQLIPKYIWEKISILDLLSDCDFSLAFEDTYDYPLIHGLCMENNINLKSLDGTKLAIDGITYLNSELDCRPPDLRFSGLEYLSEFFLSDLMHVLTSNKHLFEIKDTERYKKLSLVEF